MGERGPRQCRESRSDGPVQGRGWNGYVTNMRVEDAVAQELADGYPVVLAVSGGVDSMVLMHAAANAPGVRIAAVATYDHGTGVAATRAAARVERAARALGLTVRRGRA